MSVQRIVLTGGPGAGKTRISQALTARHPGRLIAVPEAASTIYAQRGTRWDHLDVQGRCEVQRSIYRLQREHEARYEHLHPGKTLILDRGTIDGSAYWPLGSPDDFWRDLGVSRESELARYDLVIWLQTCAVLPGIYDGSESNPCRFEDPVGAIASGDRQAQLWQAHRAFFVVDAYPTIEEKIERVQSLLRDRGVPLNPLA